MKTKIFSLMAIVMAAIMSIGMVSAATIITTDTAVTNGYLNQNSVLHVDGIKATDSAKLAGSDLGYTSTLYVGSGVGAYTTLATADHGSVDETFKVGVGRTTLFKDKTGMEGCGVSLQKAVVVDSNGGEYMTIAKTDRSFDADLSKETEVRGVASTSIEADAHDGNYTVGTYVSINKTSSDFILTNVGAVAGHQASYKGTVESDGYEATTTAITHHGTISILGLTFSSDLW
jgi:hypothetical protein